MSPIDYPKSAGLSLLIHLVALLILGILGQQPWISSQVEADSVALDLVEPSRLLGSGMAPLLSGPGPAPEPEASPAPPSSPPRRQLPPQPKIAMEIPPEQPALAAPQPQAYLPELPPATTPQDPDTAVPIAVSGSSRSAAVDGPPLYGISTAGTGPAGSATGGDIAGGGGTGGGYVGAGMQNGERPAYPQDARRKGIEGTVMIRILVDKEGNPASVSIRKSSGHPTLDQASLQAAAKWRFSPARKNGLAIASFHDVRIRFCLDDVP